MASAHTNGDKPLIKQPKQKPQLRKYLPSQPQILRNVDGDEEIILDTVLGRSSHVPYDSMDIARWSKNGMQYVRSQSNNFPNVYGTLVSAGTLNELLGDENEPEFEFAESSPVSPRLFGKIDADGYQPVSGPKYYIKNAQAPKSVTPKQAGKTPVYGKIYLMREK